VRLRDELDNGAERTHRVVLSVLPPDGLSVAVSPATLRGRGFQ